MVLHDAVLASALPGRLRVRDGQLRDAGVMARLQLVLQGLDGVLTLRANPAAGSVVVQYDGARVPAVTMQARVLAAVRQLLRAAAVPPRAAPRPVTAARPSPPVDAAPAASAPPVAPDPVRKAAARRQRSGRLRLNRYAKVGMLATLFASLLLAGVKGLHISTGIAFVALLLVHLATHRRHLLR